MNQRLTRPVPAAGRCLAAGLALLLCGCIRAADLDAGADPLVVTETGTVSYAADPSAERAAAIADMRAQAEAGEAMPYPDVFQSERSTRLAARQEPMPVADVMAIQAELADIARRQQAAVSPAEIAYLRARAAELQRLAAAAQSKLRR